MMPYPSKIDHSVIPLRYANNGNSWNGAELLGRKVFQGLGEEKLLVQALYQIGKSLGGSPSITACHRSKQSFSAYAQNKGRKCSQEPFLTLFGAEEN